MKTLIIRKPKFMRNENAMNTWLDIAKIASEQACDPAFGTDEKLMFVKIGENCLRRAAKAGGFFSTTAFYKWVTQNTTTN